MARGKEKDQERDQDGKKWLSGSWGMFRPPTITPPTLMNLKLLLPAQIFAEKTGVSRIVAEPREGAFGLLPHRLDCVAALTRPPRY